MGYWLTFVCGELVLSSLLALRQASRGNLRIYLVLAEIVPVPWLNERRVDYLLGGLSVVPFRDRP